MRALGAAFALGGLIAALAVAPASAQAPAGPTDAQRQAASRELTPAKGVGGCILSQMDETARTASLTHFGLGKPGMPPEFEAGVGGVAERCTGRPFSASDRAVANAAVGAFKRTAVAIYFAGEFAIGQRRLDDAWRRAPDSEKAPFLEAAKAVMDPKLPQRAPTLEEAKPFASRLGITSDEPGRVAPVHQYYVATALSEVAEKALADQGVRPR